MSSSRRLKPAPHFLFLATLVCSGPLCAQQESLQYSVNWPSGLSLGEGSISSKPAGTGWSLALQVDASLPGFPIKDEFRSTVTGSGCSQSFDKVSQHGQRKATETLTFDPGKGTVTRQTKNGGKSELQAPGCARDALAFLHYLRRELRQGRIPPSQPVFFGSPYQVKVEFAGARQVTLGESRHEADLIQVSAKGPSSDLNFEFYFARDAARTPLVIRAPFAMGVFSMELVR